PVRQNPQPRTAQPWDRPGLVFFSVRRGKRRPMSVTRRVVNHSVSAVFDLFTIAQGYPHWVVGAKAFRGVDEDWPQPGSTFQHRVGIGPLAINDYTRLVAIQPPQKVMLEVRAWPAGRAVAQLTLRAVDEQRTEITMDERPSSGPAVAVDSPPFRLLTRLRNRR